MKVRKIVIGFCAGALLFSCGSYRQNILFRVSPGQIAQQQAEAETRYTIQPSDLLSLNVFTNKGEKIIDPNRQSFQDDQGLSPEPQPYQYVVDADGMVKFPLVGKVKVSGLTIGQAEAMLEDAYNEFYEEAYVVLRFNNKRVVVLGAPGGQVIPLGYENMRLTEVLALAKGIPPDGRGSNIRIIRQDQVLIADLTTIEGYRRSNYLIEPGDVVYVEPVRRPFTEGLRDYAPMITIISSLATLVFIISQVN